MKQVPAVILAVVVGIALIVGIALGGQSLGFWLQKRNQNFQTTLLKIQSHQFQAAPSTQDALKSDISNKIGQILMTTAEINNMSAAQRPAWEAQRLQVTQEVCQDEAQLNPGTYLPASEQEFLSQHCIAGAANPSASY